MKIAHRMAGFRPGIAHGLDFLDAVLEIANEVVPAGFEPSCQRLGARPEGREMGCDRIFGVEQWQLGIEKTNLFLLPFHLELDRLAAQQAVDLVDVGLHLLYLDRAKAHRSPRGEARADAAADAAR